MRQGWRDIRQIVRIQLFSLGVTLRREAIQTTNHNSDTHDGRPPRHPRRLERFQYSSEGFKRYSHYLFRFPAKFHPPVAKALIERYSEPGDLVLDPFCGSGTLLIEAAILGRNAIGSDIDPVAVFVATVKSHRLNVSSLESSAARLLSSIRSMRRPDTEYERRMFADIAETTYARSIARYSLDIPQIPNIFHWFRRYVLVDLARLRLLIEGLDAPRTHRRFFLLCFASIIRRASNADPVPVSGLEVTSHMKRQDALGRVVNPFALFERAVATGLKDMSEYLDDVRKTSDIRVLRADATMLASRLNRTVDAIITSPPYHSAVDYYRRHTLEMYWLRLVFTQEERLILLPKYIGRARVSEKHRFVKDYSLASPLAKKWHNRLYRSSKERGECL